MTVLSRMLIHALRVLLPLAILSSGYLYLYPVFHGCAFPVPVAGAGHGQDGLFLKTSDDGQAIFRLLVLADPQLEGDSSLPSAGIFERLGWVFDEEDKQDEEVDTPTLAAKSKQRVRGVMEELVRSAQAARKTLDLLGNDYYLAHIYRTLHWWTRPSHVTVLGDLIGSQWVSDEEFDARGERYWRRVFRGGQRVGHPPREDVLSPEAGEGEWSRRIINIAGNHDIGYSGDISETRLERFERVFGPANWDMHFLHPTRSPTTNNHTRPGIHLINLNSLALDSPSLSEPIQTTTYDYVNDVLTRSPPVEDRRSSFTLLLTHLPLHKEAGICPDAPYIAYHDDDDPDGRFREGGLREQNHLSREVSVHGILQGVFGMSGDEHAAAGGRGRNGVILNGHDHEGCDVVHYIGRGSEGESDSESGDWSWNAARYNGSVPDTGVREVTLRSMMGEFGGNAGLLSVWFDEGDGNGNGQWQYEIQMCKAGVQHLWWAVHVLDLVVLGLIAGLLSLTAGQTGLSEKQTESHEKNEKKQKA